MKWIAAVGAVLMATGAALNLTVRAANAGAMPIAVPLDAVIQGNGAYVALTPSTPMAWASDIIRIGAWDYFSAGDFAIYAGIALFVVGSLYLVWQFVKRASSQPEAQYE